MSAGPFDPAVPAELDDAAAIRIDVPHPIFGRVGAVVVEPRSVVLASRSGGPVFDGVLQVYRRHGMILVADLLIDPPLVAGWLVTATSVFQPAKGDLGAEVGAEAGKVPDRSDPVFEPLRPATPAWDEITRRAGNRCRVYLLSGVGLFRYPLEELGARLVDAAAAGHVLGVTAEVEPAPSVGEGVGHG